MNRVCLLLLPVPLLLLLAGCEPGALAQNGQSSPSGQLGPCWVQVTCLAAEGGPTECSDAEATLERELIEAGRPQCEAGSATVSPATSSPCSQTEPDGGAAPCTYDF
jgi:hypothetical protein